MIALFIVVPYVIVGWVIGRKMVRTIYPSSKCDPFESGTIILSSMAAWPVFLLIWITGVIFDKTNN